MTTVPRFPNRAFAFAALLSVGLHCIWLSVDRANAPVIEQQGGAVNAVSVSLSHLTIEDTAVGAIAKPEPMVDPIDTLTETSDSSDQKPSSSQGEPIVAQQSNPLEAPVPTKPNKAEVGSKPLASVVNNPVSPPAALSSAVAVEDVKSVNSVPMVRKNPSFAQPPVPPRYPAIAIKRRWQGQAIIHALIDRKGKPADLVLKQSSGFPVLDRSALDAVGGWSFQPTFDGDQSIVSWVEVPVEFSLHR